MQHACREGARESGPRGLESGGVATSSGIAAVKKQPVSGEELPSVHHNTAVDQVDELAE